MNVVFTGFGPFKDVEYNPSWDCASAAAERLGAQAELLEVSVPAVRSFVERSAGDVDVLVCFGVAARRSKVCLERFAHNWWQDGASDRPTRLVDGNEAAREVSLPIDDWVEQLVAEGCDAVASHDAGNYVCNALLYFALGAVPQAVFVHVPALDQGQARDVGASVSRVIQGWLDNQ